MDKIKFNTKDAEILYSFPKSASDISTIIWCFTFINRTCPPNFEEFKNCIDKGLKAGIIKNCDEKYVIDDDWYSEIHSADTTDNEIESMLKFETKLLELTVDKPINVSCNLVEDEYKLLVAHSRS